MTTPVENEVTESIAEVPVEAQAATEAPVEAQAATEAPAVKETFVEEIRDIEKKVSEEAVILRDDFASMIAELNDKGTATQKEIIRVFEGYTANMGVGMVMSGETGIKFQVSLWKVILTTLSRSSREEFKSAWNLILNYFNKFRDTTFSEAYVFRFAEQWHLSTVELKMFQSIINLIHLTCNPATRAIGLKQVDLERTLSTGFTDEARQRIMNFYG